MADVSKASKEDIEAGLRLLQKTKEQRAKQRDKLKNDPAAKEKAAARALRLRVKNSILTSKALKAGITVSDAEIEAEIKKNKK